MFSFIFETVALRRFVSALAQRRFDVLGSDGEMSANNFYRDFGELSIPLFALLAMAVRCLLLPELAQNLARCAAAP